MASLGDIVIGLTMDNRRFTATAQQSRSTLASLGTSALGVVGQVAGLLGVGTAIASVGWGVKLAAEAEQTQIAFEVMLGSEQKAKALLDDLKGYADKSPFDLAGTNEAAKKLLNYGIAGDKVLPTIRMLGDVASGDKEKFGQLSTAFGQMSATGRLMGQDLNQFINAGFNPLQEIAKKTGESMIDLKARMEAGGISSKEVGEAFKIATSEGGRFYQMTERQSQTVAGKFSTLSDSVAGTLRTIGQELTTRLHISGLLDAGNEFLSRFPDYFRQGMDVAESIVTVGSDAITGVFSGLYSAADSILVQIGDAIGVHLDMNSVLAHLTDFGSQVPMIFRNAGALLEVTILDWHIYFYELFPAVEGVMQKIGSVLVATWDGSTAAFGSFFQNLVAGLEEIKNLALATWESIKAGIAAIGQGKNPLAAASDAFTSTLAGQKDANGGEHFATSFQKAFDQSMKDSTEGFKDQGGLAAGLRARKEELLKGITANEESRLKPIDAQESRLLKSDSGDSDSDDDSEGKGKKKKSGKKADNSAALVGSAEAAKIMLAGVFGNKDKAAIDIAKQQLAAQNATVTAIKANKDKSAPAVINIT